MLYPRTENSILKFMAEVENDVANITMSRPSKHSKLIKAHEHDPDKSHLKLLVGEAAYWTAEGNSRNNVQATAFTGYYRSDGQFLCPTVSSEGNKKNTKRSMYSIRPILVEN